MLDIFARVACMPACRRNILSLRYALFETGKSVTVKKKEGKRKETVIVRGVSLNRVNS